MVRYILSIINTIALALHLCQIRNLKPLYGLDIRAERGACNCADLCVDVRLDAALVGDEQDSGEGGGARHRDHERAEGAHPALGDLGFSV